MIAPSSAINVRRLPFERMNNVFSHSLVGFRDATVVAALGVRQLADLRAAIVRHGNTHSWVARFCADAAIAGALGRRMLDERDPAAFEELAALLYFSYMHAPADKPLLGAALLDALCCMTASIIPAGAKPGAFNAYGTDENLRNMAYFLFYLLRFVDWDAVAKAVENAPGGPLADFLITYVPLVPAVLLHVAELLEHVGSRTKSLLDTLHRIDMLAIIAASVRGMHFIAHAREFVFAAVRLTVALADRGRDASMWCIIRILGACWLGSPLETRKGLCTRLFQAALSSPAILLWLIMNPGIDDMCALAQRCPEVLDAPVRSALTQAVMRQLDAGPPPPDEHALLAFARILDVDFLERLCAGAGVALPPGPERAAVLAECRADVITLVRAAAAATRIQRAAQRLAARAAVSDEVDGVHQEPQVDGRP